MDDLSPSATAFAAFVTSPHAHARITSIDVRAALRMPGVLGVWTAADLVDHPDLPGGLPGFERPAMALDVVRFVGEPVAVVVAEDRYAATDAIGAVEVEYAEHLRNYLATWLDIPQNLCRGHRARRRWRLRCEDRVVPRAVPGTAPVEVDGPAGQVRAEPQ